MQQFIVPQFIDVESKILGPVTVRQFVISLAGGFLLVIAYKLFDFALFILSAVFIGFGVFLFGFFKVNGRPFHRFLVSFIKTFSRPAIRVWRTQDIETPSLLPSINKHASTSVVSSSEYKLLSAKKRLTQSRLQELSLIVDTGGLYQSEEDFNTYIEQQNKS